MKRRFVRVAARAVDAGFTCICGVGTACPSCASEMTWLAAIPTVESIARGSGQYAAELACQACRTLCCTADIDAQRVEQMLRAPKAAA